MSSLLALTSVAPTPTLTRNGSTVMASGGSSSTWVYGLQGVAAMLGVPMQQIQQLLSSGETLAEIVQANGRSTADGSTALLAGIRQGLSADVAAGALSPSQAALILKNQLNKVTLVLARSGAPRRALPTAGESRSSMLDVVA